MIPILLLPIRERNVITDKFNGEIKIAITPINFANIKNISEDKETGFAVIEALNSSEMQDNNIYTAIPFIEMFNHLNSMRIVDSTFINYCIPVSKTLEDFVEELMQSNKKPE